MKRNAHRQPFPREGFAKTFSTHPLPLLLKREGENKAPNQKVPL